MLKKILIVFFSLVGLGACTSLPHRKEVLSSQGLRAEAEKRALSYFLENTNAHTGLVRDWAYNFGSSPTTDRTASIAATGFGLAVIANASLRGFVKPEFAKAYALRALTFCRDHVARHHGWFLHFVDWETGSPLFNSEYSTIDTAWFVAGALYAGQVLRDPEVQKLVHQIYGDLDFKDMLTDGGAQPDKLTLSMGYEPGVGYLPYEWNGYSEQKLLLIMGLGHALNPLPQAAWAAFDRKQTTLANGDKVMGLENPLFVHQYSQLYLDLRHFKDSYDVNYFENSLKVTKWHRELTQRDHHFQTLKAGFWGFSAGYSPLGYDAYSALHYSATVCIGCTVASVMFWPDQISADMMAWITGPYQDKIWGRYGFTDSINLDQNWFSDRVYGITVGPEYMAIANLNAATSIWKDFMAIPEIQSGLARAVANGPSLSTAAEAFGPHRMQISM